MQEEVTGKSVAVIIKGAKISEKVLEKALGKLLEAQKNKHPKVHRGKQTLKQLAGQNAGLANIEITDQNIRFIFINSFAVIVENRLLKSNGANLRGKLKS